MKAEAANLQQSASREVTADRVEMSQSAALRARSSLIEARQSALGLVQTNEVFLKQGAAAAVRADNAELAGLTGFVAANTVQAGHATAGVMVGRRIHADQIRALVVIGNHVEGDIHVAFDKRQAIMAGLLGGLLGGLILTLTRVLFRRD
ncbi:MAG: hypothetical protein ACK2UU_00655 [Anaerolineae bacterium]